MDKSKKDNLKKQPHKRRHETLNLKLSPTKRSKLNDDLPNYTHKPHKATSYDNNNHKSDNKFSANNRLETYRRIIQAKKNQPCKVHTLEEIPPSKKDTTELPKGEHKCQYRESHFAQKKFPFSEDVTNPCGNVSAKRQYSSVDTDRNNRNQKCNDLSKSMPVQSWSESSRNHNYENCSDRKKNEYSTVGSGSVQNRLKRLSHKNGTSSNGKQLEDSSYKIEYNSNIVRSERLTEQTSRNLLPNDSKLPITTDIDMDMEWSPIDENDAVLNVEKIRENIQEITAHHTKFQESVAMHKNQMSHNKSIFKDIYIVVDTNIFLSHLDVVKSILHTKINGVEVPYIYIPWMVIQELDYIKDGTSGGTSLHCNAQHAIKFINEKLMEKNGHCKGQTLLDAGTQKSSGTNADDNIIACCLQVVEKGNKPILLTNDVNLRNKAAINQIDSYAHNTIMKFLNPPEEDDSHDGQRHMLMEYMQELLNHLIVEEMKEAYGKVWEKMGYMGNRPWLLEGCLMRIEKYWMSVFSARVQKQCLRLVQNFRSYLLSADRSEESTRKMLEFSTNLCIFLKSGFENYKDCIESCIKKMHKVVPN